MALVIKDRVKETTTTTGTGTYTLAGAVSGFETFTANLSNADTTYYVCTDNTDFEVGLGTFTSSGTTLARTTILASSNSNNAVNWSSGTRSIFMTYPADKAVFEDADGHVSIPHDLFIAGGLIDLKNDGGAVSQIKFYCESSNAHAQTLIGAPHSESASNTLTLPSSGGDAKLVSATSTATLTNKTLTTPTINGATLGSGNLATSSNGDINFAPNGTGKIVVRGNTNQGKIVLNCESNSHGQTIIAAPHSESANNVLTLPSTGGDARLVSATSTATLTNKTLTSPKINEDVAVTSTATELNILDGVTSTTAELNILDGVTSTTAELNILDGVTASAADINLIDGITNGTVIASKAIITDSNKDITGGRNITISGELDAATLDISGDADIDGTLEADAITVGGTALNTVIAGVTVTNATNATNATHVTVTDNESTSETNLITFVENAQSGTGNHGLEMDGNLSYGPSDGRFSAPILQSLNANLQSNLIFTNTSGQLCFGMDGSTSNVVLVLDDEDGQPIFTFSEEGGTAILDGGDTDVTSHKPFIANSTITASGRIIVDDTTEATNTTDGSIQTDGGLSVTKDIYVGDDIKLGDNLALLSDASVIFFGADNEVTLTHIHNDGLRLNSDNQLQFGDSGTYIHQSADGVLDLVSDTEIEINATTIDMNGNLDVSGSLTLGGTAITSTAAELNILDGVTATASELNIMDGVTSTTAELNILDGVTATASELNIMDGVTATTAELNHSDGVTSNIQTQLDAKATKGFATAMAIAL